MRYLQQVKVRPHSSKLLLLPTRLLAITDDCIADVFHAARAITRYSVTIDGGLVSELYFY